MTPPSGEPPRPSSSPSRAPSGWGARPEHEHDPRNAPRQGSGPRQYFVPADAAGGSPSQRGDARSEGGAAGPPRPPGAPPRRRVASPGQGEPPAGRRPRRRRRGRARRIALFAVVALVLAVVGGVLYGLWQFQSMERVAVGDVLSAAGGGGTNYLIVGSDSREGFDPGAPNAGAVLGDGTAGDTSQRSDTMLVLRVTDDGALMTSIPRDLWVRRPDGSEGRINAAYRDGPASLVRTVQTGVGIPIHRYMEVDFVTFAGLVDAVGGVEVEVPHPARDLHSGLDIPEAGRVTLDGTQALAYVRSRHHEELVDGSWVGDPTGDLGRVQRQQAFLRAVMGEVGSTRNPISLLRISSAVSDGLRIDDEMGMFDALGFAWRLRGLQPESVELPTYPFQTGGGAAVLGLVEPDARSVIATFGG